MVLTRNRFADMDGYSVQTPEFLGTLSFGEKKTVGQFQSLIPLNGSSLHHIKSHEVNSFQQSSSIPLSFSQDQLEKVAKMNGYNIGLQMENEHVIRSSPFVNSATDAEGSNNVAGLHPLCIEYQRPRSHSMGLAVTAVEFQSSRSHSRDSLASSGSLVDEYQLPKRCGSSEEALVEVTCNKFKRLSTKGIESPHSVSPVNRCQEFKSPSHSLPQCDPDVVRKYSFGSHTLTAKRQLSNYGCLPGQRGLPMDLTCKRKKSDATSTSLVSVFLHSGEVCQAQHIDQNHSESKEQPNDDGSILKSVLVGVGMGRKRSHTLSVCSRQHFRKDSRDTPVGISSRQQVTLAKRNLGPVMGRVSEYLNRITRFLSSQVDFVKLPSDDQKCLVADSIHRLLILYLAESNLQFVVTPVREDDEKSVDGSSALEVPTMQFAETVQNFIGKCQALNISSSEYDLMRVMTLFHTGSHPLENSAAVERANAEAQQCLQSFIQQSYPNERLRYSKLLLTIYTLFGINCPMLEALFCHHLIPGDFREGGGGLVPYVFSEFLAIKVPKSCS